MVQKALAILLAVSWIVLTKVDLLEDLNLERRDSPSGFRLPSKGKAVKLASDHVELASRALERLFRSSDLESSTCTQLAGWSLGYGVLRSRKDNCILLI